MTAPNDDSDWFVVDDGTGDMVGPMSRREAGDSVDRWNHEPWKSPFEFRNDWEGVA
jgi:hypothetical protein